MTKYLEINCDLAQKLAGYGLWIGVSIILLFGVFVQQSTLESYSDGFRGEIAFSDKCMIEYFSGEKVCSYLMDAYSYDFNSKEMTQIHFNAFSIMFVAFQIVCILVLNWLKEWVGVRCKT